MCKSLGLKSTLVQACVHVSAYTKTLCTASAHSTAPDIHTWGTRGFPGSHATHTVTYSSQHFRRLNMACPGGILPPRLCWQQGPTQHAIRRHLTIESGLNHLSLPSSIVTLNPKVHPHQTHVSDHGSTSNCLSHTNNMSCSAHKACAGGRCSC